MGDENMGRERNVRKYIFFLISIILVLVLSMQMISIGADPVEETTAVPEQPTETPTAEPTTEPTLTPAPATKTPAPATPTPGASSQPPRTWPPTLPPAPTTVPNTIIPGIPSPAPTMEVTAEPSSTPNTEVTIGPVDTNDLLPTFQPDIASGSSIYMAGMETDLNGYVIRIAASWDETRDPLLDQAVIAAFEKTYNCQVVFLDLSKKVIYEGLLISCATGVTYFDAILTDSGTILVDLEPLGLLDAFSKYMTAEEIQQIPPSYQKVLSAGGSLYGIPAHAPDMSGIWVNKEFIGKYSIVPNPIQDYQENTWIWNRFNSTLFSAMGDKDGDGYYDIFGLSVSSRIYTPVLESMGGSIFRWTGSQFISGITNKVSLQGLKLMQDLYQNNLIANEGEKYFYLESSGLLAGEISMYSAIKQYFPKKEFVFLPYPSLEEGKQALSVTAYADCAAIVKTSRYPAHTAALLKLLYGKDNFQKRAEQYCKDNGFDEVKQVKEAYFKMLELFTVDFTKAFDKDDVLENNLMSLIKNGTFSDETIKSQISPIIEQLIAWRKTPVNLKRIPVQINW